MATNGGYLEPKPKVVIAEKKENKNEEVSPPVPVSEKRIENPSTKPIENKEPEPNVVETPKPVVIETPSPTSTKPLIIPPDFYDSKRSFFTKKSK